MDEPDPRIGAQYGPYRLDRRLGEGGMATVYAATHSRTSREYALKLLHSRTKGSQLERQMLARFRREARALSGLRHAHVVAIHDFDVTDRGEPYLVMDLLEGEPLSDRILSRAALPWDEAVLIFDQLASALSALHAAGVVHRDVKPSNVLLSRMEGEEERAVLIDLGLAKQLVSDATAVTAPDTALGTPSYMAPEQARGEAVDEQTDLYALGIVLYEMLAGRPPFVGPTPTAVIAQALVDPPLPVTSICQATLPPGVDEVLARALAKDPKDRYADMNELSLAVRELTGQRDSSVPRTRAVSTAGRPAAGGAKGRRWPLALGGVLGVLGLVAGSWALGHYGSDTPEESTPPLSAEAPVELDAPVLVPLEARPDAAIAREGAVPDAAAPPEAVSAPVERTSVAASGRNRRRRRETVVRPPVGPAATPPQPSTPRPRSNAPTSPTTIPAGPLPRAREAASRRDWTACVAALDSQARVERRALEVFLICADHAHDRSALQRGCREVERLLLHGHPWYRRCHVEILGGGTLRPEPARSQLNPDDQAERDARGLRQRGDFAGCARALDSVSRSYSAMMLRLDCAELSRNGPLLRRACRRYIDAQIPAQTRFNPLCADVLRRAAGVP